MEPNGEEGPSPADRPDPPEEGAARPQVAYPFFEEEEEFDDEPPGAYLEEGRLGGRSVAWGGLLALAVLGVAVVGWVWKDEFGHPAGPAEPIEAVAPLDLAAPDRPDFDPEVLRFPLAVAWTILPVVAGFSFLITLFIRLNQGPRGPREAKLGSLAVNLQLAAVLLWLAARYFLGVDFGG